MKAISPPTPNERVAGVVVTYFPDSGFPRRLAAIAREANPLIVVDNTAAEGVPAQLRPLCRQHGVQLIENAENSGLAAALNQGLTLAEQAGCNWMIAFDQDSTPEMGFASALQHTASAHGQTTAIVGANWHDEARPEQRSRHVRRKRLFPLFFERATATSDLHDVTCVITSGTLFHVPTVRALGGFDEGLFLDLVDFDLCLRARAAEHAIRVASAARLAHRRGAKRPVRFAGRTWWPAFMPEARLFYLFRNRMRLIGRHGFRFPHWVAYELVYATKVLADILILEDRKAAKLWACVRGTWHGMLGRDGKMR